MLEASPPALLSALCAAGADEPGVIDGLSDMDEEETRSFIMDLLGSRVSEEDVEAALVHFARLTDAAGVEARSKRRRLSLVRDVEIFGLVPAAEPPVACPRAPC